VTAGSTTGTWGDQLIGYRQISSAYLQTLENMSLFDAAVGSMIQLPLNPPASAAVATAAVVAGVTGERKPRPLSQASFSATPLDELEASCIVVASEELLRNAATLTSILDNEMKLAIAVAMNAHFVAAIIPVGSPDPAIASSGADPDDVLADLRDAVDMLDVDQLSKLLIGVPPDVCARMAFMGSIDGPAFPQMTPQGGFINGTRVIPTEALTDEVLVIDAHAFAGNPGDIIVDSTDQATIQFETDPTDPPDANTVMTSLWQTNRRALRVRRRFGFQQLRTRSVARIASVTWGATA